MAIQTQAMRMSRTFKFFCAYGVLLALGGLSCGLMVCLVATSTDFEVDFEAGGEQSLTLAVPEYLPRGICGFSLYISREQNCAKVHANTVIEGPDGKSNLNSNRGIELVLDCHIDDSKQWSACENLVRVGHFSIPFKDGTTSTLTGEYSVTSPVAMWAEDVWGQLSEAVDGITVLLGLLVTAICCVACCCMDSGGEMTKTDSEW
mmetsp:Transcript_161605/g.513575  ORF Transcript_161605/g.513575 Transcript_161605/m.513575 type:complete len:204 (+) Transcript_161605:109-720(+)